MLKLPGFRRLIGSRLLFAQGLAQSDALSCFCLTLSASFARFVFELSDAIAKVMRLFRELCSLRIGIGPSQREH